VVDSDGLTEDELEAMERRCGIASPGPWVSFIGPGIGGPDFIRVGESDDEPDMYVSRDGTPASPADLEFIAGARPDIPRLIAEIRRLRCR
jgi:hypothetical protein